MLRSTSHPSLVNNTKTAIGIAISNKSRERSAYIKSSHRHLLGQSYSVNDTADESNSKKKRRIVEYFVLCVLCCCWFFRASVCRQWVISCKLRSGFHTRSMCATIRTSDVRVLLPVLIVASSVCFFFVQLPVSVAAALVFRLRIRACDALRSFTCHASARETRASEAIL